MPRTIYVIVLLAIVSVSSLRARATSSLDFGISSRRGGGISFNYALKPLIGRGIKVTALDYGSEYLPMPGRLNFTTGKLISSTPNEWMFGGGGTLTITGCVDWNLDHDKSCDRHDYRGTLLSGTFLNAVVIDNRDGTKTLQAFLTDEINPRLAQFLGLPSGGPSHSELDLSFVGNGIPPHAIRRTRILGGYLGALAVPEPSSLPLFGSGLAAIGMLLYRPKRRQST